MTYKLCRENINYTEYRNRVKHIRRTVTRQLLLHGRFTECWKPDWDDGRYPASPYMAFTARFQPYEVPAAELQLDLMILREGQVPYNKEISCYLCWIRRMEELQQEHQALGSGFRAFSVYFRQTSDGRFWTNDTDSSLQKEIARFLRNSVASWEKHHKEAQHEYRHI